jgi:hypothetical protein
MTLTKKQIAEVEANVVAEVAAWEKEYLPDLEAAFAAANKYDDADEEFEAVRDALRKQLATSEKRSLRRRR